jgi:hypothetical protein
MPGTFVWSRRALSGAAGHRFGHGIADAGRVLLVTFGMFATLIARSVTKR